MESLLTILFLLLLSAISSWLTQRRGRAGADEAWEEEEQVRKARERQADARERGELPPRLPQDKEVARRPSWEEQLRRLIEGDRPAQPAPPVIQAERPRPQPQPRPLPQASEVSRDVRSKKTSASPEAVVREVSRDLKEAQRKLAERVQETSARTTTRVPSVMDKAQALRHAVSERARGMLRQPAGAPLEVLQVIPDSRRRTSAEIGAALSMLNQPRTSRQAFIASLVFQPNKALEQLDERRERPS